MRLIILFFLLTTSLFSENLDSPETILENLSLDEKVGQLFMAEVSSENCNLKKINDLITTHHVGGLIFMKGTVNNQIELINHFQSISKLPLFVGQDNEWGLNLRLKNTIRFPRNMTLGAIQNDDLIYELGREVARQCKLVGVNVNFAPVVDINSNPLNPVISDRSFGEDKYLVAKKAKLFAKGMQDENIIACAKHWPGHGDTLQDSHKVLPLISKNWTELQEQEVYPFKELIDQDIKSIMTAHIFLPKIDKQTSSLSKKIITDYLTIELGFQGLIFSDSNAMKAITDNFKAGDADTLAIKAGTDIILCPQDISTAVYNLKQAIKDGTFTEKELDHHVLKILTAKRSIGLNIQSLNLNPDIHTTYAKELKRRLFESAITVVKNDNDILPLKQNQSVIFLQIGKNIQTTHSIESSYLVSDEYVLDNDPPFYTKLNSFFPIERIYLSKNPSQIEVENTLKRLSNYTTVIIGLYEMHKWKDRNFGLMNSALELIKKTPCNVILTIFGSPYSLINFKNESSIIVAYENDSEAQIAAAKVILGKMYPQGKLPVTGSNEFPFGKGISLTD